MKKLMLICNYHPNEIAELVQHMYAVLGEREDVLILSAQAVGLMIEEVKGISYNASFDVTIKTLQNELNAIIEERKPLLTIIVGTLEKSFIPFFDAILSFQQLDEEGVPYIAQWPVETALDVLQITDADIHLNSYRELDTFIVKFYKMLQSKGEQI